MISPSSSSSTGRGTAPITVLGTGSIGKRHLTALRRVCPLPPIAVPIRPERIGPLREEGWTTASSLEEARSMGSDRAVIATETLRHPDDALRALSLGMKALIEKPAAADADGAARILEAADRLGEDARVACVLRYSEGLLRLRSLLPEIGPVSSAFIECRSYLPDWRPDRPYLSSYSARAEDGGVLRDLIHEIDYAGWLFGWPESVEASLFNDGVLGIEAEERADLAWTAPTGCRVRVGLDYLTRPPTRRAAIVGKSGELFWDALAGTIRLTVKNRALPDISVESDLEHAYEAQIRSWIDAEASPDRPAPIADGVAALAICDAARRSSETGARAEVVR